MSTFNEGYEDCTDPYKGRLTRKPHYWSNAEWREYQEGVRQFGLDSHNA